MIAKTQVIAARNVVGVYDARHFAVERPTWRLAANVVAMRTAGRIAVGLNRVCGSRAGDRIGIVTYHRVSPVVRGFARPSHNVTPDRFRAHVAGLLDRGYVIRPLAELLDASACGTPLPPRTIALTFDDGFQSVYTEAWPVLHELRVPATVFLVTGFLDATAPFPFDTWGQTHAASLPPAMYRPLTSEQCREMAADGLIEFGAHTHTHRDLRGRPEEFREDVQTSVDIVRAMFGCKEVMFAFPTGSRRFGFAGPELVAAAKLTGVACGLTTECSLVEPGSDPFTWGRFNAFSWDTAETLAAKLNGWYTWAAQVKWRFARGGPCAESAGASASQISPAAPRSCPRLRTGLPRNACGAPESSGRDMFQFPRAGVVPPRQEKVSPGAEMAELGRKLHVVKLVNIVHPADRQIYLRLAERVGKLTILVSSPLGLHGIEPSDWQSLDVRLQRTVTLHHPQRHPLDFREMIDVHIPWDTASQLKSLRPDVVLTSELGFRSLFSAFYTMRHPQVPLIVWVNMTDHTERGRGWARYLLRQWLCRRADAVLVNGDGARRCVSRFGVPEDRTYYAPYATLPESSYAGLPTRDASAAHHLLYVGQFVQRKGLLPFLDVLARWSAAHKDRQVEFSLIGSGPQEDAIRNFPLPQNLRVHLFGRRKPAEIAEFHATTGIFVLPTLADEWGLVVNEAMASGLPVLGSLYSQAVEQLCENGRTGWTFRPDRPEEMAGAIDAALNTPAEALDVMRIAARQQVAHLTADFVADQLVDAIGRTVTRKQK